LNQRIKQILEALLFTTNEPLSLERLESVLKEEFSIKKNEILFLLKEWEKETVRGVTLCEVAGGFYLKTAPQFAPYIEKLQKKKKERLSKSLKEVLAIIAFKQPITRAQVELIRGVDCSSHIQSLIEKDLIEAKGKLEAPGNPTLFQVTESFLKHFGLSSPKELIESPNTEVQSERISDPEQVRD
jgi:segregation and condensation protein B